MALTETIDETMAGLIRKLTTADDAEAARIRARMAELEQLKQQQHDTT